jgi:hypothetical protein
MGRERGLEDDQGAFIQTIVGVIDVEREPSPEPEPEPKPKSKPSPKSRSQTPPLSPEPKLKPRKRTIVFNQKIGVALVMSLAEYTDEEADRTWYNVEEYAEMEDECDFTSELLENPSKPLPKQLCARGLECWTLEGEQSKEHNVGEAIELVWQAQLAQWKNKGDGQEFIREQYLQITEPCHAAAHEVGMRDEAEVKKYLASTRAMEKSRRKVAKATKHTRPDEPKLKGILKKEKKKKESTASKKLKSPKTPKTPGRRSKLTVGKTPKASGGGRVIKASGIQAPSSPGKSVVSSASSTGSRKIARSRAKVPHSPTGSVHSASEFSTGSRRKYSSHASVCSDDSSLNSLKRRMLKKPPL